MDEVQVTLSPRVSRGTARWSRRTRRAAAAAGICGALAMAADAGAQIGQPAPGLQDDGDVGAAKIPVPQIPAEPYDLISIQATNSTVRPEHREFNEDLMAGIRLPEGFAIGVFARDLEEPRSIVVALNGDVYVAEREAGRVRLLRDSNGDGRADLSRVVTAGLREELRGVHGLAIHEGRLYMVTETELYAATILGDGGLSERELLMDAIPAGGQHPNRTIGFAPDGTLFLSIGSTCNACVEPMADHAAMHRVNLADGERELHAEGLRNTIGFAWHPLTNEFWGFDHNSDGRGENWPPEELNRIVEGAHYGWPFCGGDREPDHHLPADPEGPEPMTKQAFCATTEPPALTYQGHAAPMQMAFYTAMDFPAEYRNDAFVTMRGSWNRNPPAGYEVVRVRFDDAGSPVAIEPFASGWLLEDGRAHFGRLMGIAQSADGALLIGDDTNGIVYRVEYVGG
jgi:glucose/arabinose dehydrogenase